MWKLSKVFKLLCEFCLWGFHIASNLRMHSHCSGDEVDIDRTQTGEFHRTQQICRLGTVISMKSSLGVYHWIDRQIRMLTGKARFSFWGKHAEGIQQSNNEWEFLKLLTYCYKNNPSACCCLNAYYLPCLKYTFTS